MANAFSVFDVGLKKKVIRFSRTILWAKDKSCSIESRIAVLSGS